MITGENSQHTLLVRLLLLHCPLCVINSLITDSNFAGKWDTMVAGGLSVGHTIIETAHKEAMEEASVPTDLMKKLQSAGVVS